MYVSSEATFVAPGVGGQGNGQLQAQLGCLRNVVVTAVCVSNTTGSPTLTLDSQLGDNAPSNYGSNPPNSDTAFASGAVATTGLTLPSTAGNSASISINGAYRSLRLNLGGTLTGGSLKIQVSAEDVKD